jgi:glycine hydroxymethyltransferase
VPFDPERPTVTSGLRLGSAACTTRGLGMSDFRQVGHMIVEVLDGLAANGEAGNTAVETRVKQAVAQLCARFPIYE